VLAMMLVYMLVLFDCEVLLLCLAMKGFGFVFNFLNDYQFRAWCCGFGWS